MPQLDAIRGKPLRRTLAAARPANVDPCSILAEADTSVVTLQVDGSDTTLTRDAEACDRLRNVLSALGSDVTASADEDRPAVLLHDRLPDVEVVHRLDKILWDSKLRLPLPELAGRLFPEASKPAALQATLHLLDLAAKARSKASEWPLIPHRLHVVARGAEGISVCLNAQCAGGPTFPGLGRLTAGHVERCPSCQSIALTLFRCNDCGHVLLCGVHSLDSLGAWTGLHFNSRARLFRLADSTAPRIECVDPRSGEPLAPDDDGVKLEECKTCPGCKRDVGASDSDDDEGDDWSSRVQAMPTPEALLPSLVAEATLSEVPVLSSPRVEWLPAHGRRILAFSDSRREAARLGTRLSYQHALWVVRSVLAEVVRKLPETTPEGLQELHEEIAAQEQRVATATTPLKKGKEQRSLDDLLGMLNHALHGVAVQELEAMVKHDSTLSARLAELLHMETSHDHQAAAWGQARWESNATRVRQNLPPLVARELARRPANNLTLETVGLIEVVYPGVDTWTPSQELLQCLTTKQQREALRQQWPSLVRAICDTLRMDGIVTIAANQDDTDVDDDVDQRLTSRSVRSEHDAFGELVAVDLPSVSSDSSRVYRD